MKRFIALSGLIACMAAGTGCGVILVSEEQEFQLGATSYQEMLAESKLSRDPAELDPLRRVGKRIAAVSQKKGYAWEFNVIIDDETANAWCLPGGKIAFYTGLFPMLEDEAGMAFVMGHEVSHALARHGVQRMSQQMLMGAAGSLLATAIGGRDEGKRAKVLSCYGIATGLAVMLPYSRSHESEADRMGLELMARAGYDPRAAVAVWKRMAEKNPKSMPEFLSTHPSHVARIRDLEAELPRVLAIYEKSAKAKTAKLPEVLGKERPAEKPKEVKVKAVPGAWKRGILEGDRKALQLGFKFDRDVYVGHVHVEGPGPLDLAFDAGNGIPAGATKAVTLYRKEAGGKVYASGRYRVTFRGRASGSPFTASCEFDVPKPKAPPSD